MAIRDESTVRVVLYEGEGAAPLESNDRFAAMSALLERGYAVTRSTQNGRVAPQDRGALVVLGKFASPPAGEDAAGAVNLRFHDITGRDTAGITALVEEERAALGASQPGAWKPWFPV